MDQETILEQEETPELQEENAENAEFSERCEKAKCACRATLDRLKNDLKATNGNPYIRATSTVRYEILRTPNDEEAIDTFEVRKVNGCSLRTLAIAAGVFAAFEILSLRAKIKKAKKKK